MCADTDIHSLIHVLNYKIIDLSICPGIWTWIIGVLLMNNSEMFTMLCRPQIKQVISYNNYLINSLAVEVGFTWHGARFWHWIHQKAPAWKDLFCNWISADDSECVLFSGRWVWSREMYTFSPSNPLSGSRPGLQPLLSSEQRPS